PWAIAADNQYVIAGGTSPGTFAQNHLWVTHSGNNTVTRFGNTILLKNNYIVGSTTNPGPRGIIFDSSTTSGQAGSLWVANSAERTLSRIWMRLSVESSDTNNGGPLAC